MEKLTRFMKNVFPTLEEDEFITVVRINDNKTEEIRCKNIDEAVSFCNRKDKYFYNSYYSLATTDGIGRTTNNLRRRSCLVWDFDKKDLGQDFNVKDILHLFKSIRLYYHAIIDTGHGWHVYVFIEKTTDLEAVEAVQKAVAIRLGADTHATLKTQLMRVPGTVNIKHGNKLPVKIVYLADEGHIKRLPISHYTYNYVTTRYTRTNIEYVMRDDKTPQCVRDILEAGSPVGQRNEDLQTIIVALKRQHKTLAEIRAVISEWLENTEELERLDYMIEYIYENVYNGPLDCKNCPHRKECYVVNTVVDTSQLEGQPVLSIADRDILKSKNSRSKRKGRKYMTGKMLVVYTMLLRDNATLDISQLKDRLTYKSEAKDIAPKCCMSDKTIRNTLKELEENGFIEVKTIDRKKVYKLKPNRVSAENKFTVSYASAYEVVKGCITAEEFQLYCYMKYLCKITPKKRGEDPFSLQVNQNKLADDLGVDKSRVSQMIQNLLDEKLIQVYSRNKSKNNNFMYNTYLLNY